MRAEATAFTLSILINVATFAGLDSAAVHYDDVFRTARLQEMKLRDQERARREATQFEFVEAPPKVSSRKPLNARKISDRDSVAQDATPAKETKPREAPPMMEKQGPSDQLAQQRVDSATAPKAASSPSVPRPPVQEQQASPPQPQPTSALDQPKNQPEDSLQKTLEPLPDGISAMPPQQPPAQPQQAQPPSVASVPAKPAPAVKGLTGADRITTQPFSRSRSHGAQVQGRTSFEATGSGMGRYMKEMKERIWLAWFPYLAFHYPKDFRSADAVLSFRIGADGQLRSVQVVASEGSPVFAAFCVEAVQRAAPFEPLPAELLDLTGRDDLEAEFAFHFW